jgi:hypothetical protein
MYLLIIQWSIISLFLIVLIHYLYGFFQTTLTIPKIKDLVNRPASAYKEMYNTINNDYHSGNNKDYQLNKNTNANKNNYPQNSESTNQPSSTNQNMKDELKSYLNNLSNAEPASANNVSSFDSGNAYSSY